MLNLFQSSLVLPNNLQRLLQAVAMNRFDPIIGYGYAMAITSALVQPFCKLRIGHDFESEVCLYFLSIAPSGSGKGSMWKHLSAPVNLLLEKQRRIDSEENRRRKCKRDAIDGVLAEKKKQARRLSGAALESLLGEIADWETKKEPLIPELVFDVQDVTPAALLHLLSLQKGHSLLIADTEGRFVRCIDEEKSLSAMLNQTFLGEPVGNSRVSSGSTRVENPHVSIAVAVQQEKLGRLTRNSNLWGEGFFARILPYFAQPMLQFTSAIGEIVDAAIMEWWQQKIAELFSKRQHLEEQGHDKTHWIEFDEEARKLFESHAQQRHAMKSWPTFMGLQANLARLPEQIARIAAIYHILEHPDPFGSKVSGYVMQLAINAGMFFWEQTQMLYAQFHPDPALKLIPKICGWLKSRIGTVSYVTAKDIYQAIGGEKRGLMRAIQILCQQGVLYPQTELREQPNFNQWPSIKSHGFGINFPLLSGLPD